MHRAAWIFNSLSSRRDEISFQSRTRLRGGTVDFIEALVLHEAAHLVELGEALACGRFVDDGVFDINKAGFGARAVGGLSMRGCRGFFGEEEVFKAFGGEVDLACGVRGNEVDSAEFLLLFFRTDILLLENALVVKRHNTNEHGE